MSITASARARSQRRRLSIVLALNSLLLLGLAAIELVSNSIGVLAPAGNTLGDIIGLILGLIAVTIRNRHPDDPRAQ